MSIYSSGMSARATVNAECRSIIQQPYLRILPNVHRTTNMFTIITFTRSPNTATIFSEMINNY